MAVPSPTRFGVLLPTREQAILGRFAASPLLGFARQAERPGFGSLWTGDSLTACPRLDPLVVLPPRRRGDERRHPGDRRAHSGAAASARPAGVFGGLRLVVLSTPSVRQQV